MTFQSLEEDRLAHIRDSLWRVANISSLAAVADDLAAEEVRKTLEVSKLDDAIQGNYVFFKETWVNLTKVKSLQHSRDAAFVYD